ncbi:hypothetical protein OIU84_029917, partial [Salix udensis]
MFSITKMRTMAFFSKNPQTQDHNFPLKPPLVNQRNIYLFGFVHGTLIKGRGAMESDAGSRNFEKPNTS